MELDLPIVTEVMDSAGRGPRREHADALRSRHTTCRSSPRLRAIGKSGKLALLETAASAKIEELLLAAEYLLAAGNDQVVLASAASGTFETATRNTLDLNAIPYIAEDASAGDGGSSHGTGIRDRHSDDAGGAACRADGILVEVHRDPAVADSDGAWSLYPDQFMNLMKALDPVVKAVGRQLARIPATSDTGEAWLRLASCRTIRTRSRSTRRWATAGAGDPAVRTLDPADRCSTVPRSVSNAEGMKSCQYRFCRRGGRNVLDIGGGAACRAGRRTGARSSPRCVSPRLEVRGCRRGAAQRSLPFPHAVRADPRLTRRPMPKPMALCCLGVIA